ncbi:MAG: hypothetical protein DRR42_09895 [Gammaproteobacteria bacterium]|nr:MAG: hypothetical protein DRR42_09895 [Gammaproteobacteria bacterium]
MNKHYDFVIRKPNEAAKRITELEAELEIAKAFIHWVVIERDNLRQADTKKQQNHVDAAIARYKREHS